MFFWVIKYHSKWEYCMAFFVFQRIDFLWINSTISILFAALRTFPGPYMISGSDISTSGVCFQIYFFALDNFLIFNQIRYSSPHNDFSLGFSSFCIHAWLHAPIYQKTMIYSLFMTQIYILNFLWAFLGICTETLHKYIFESMARFAQCTYCTR